MRLGGALRRVIGAFGRSRRRALTVLAGERDEARQEASELRARVAMADRWQWFSRFVPPGHFYSPVPDLAEIEPDAARLFPAELPRTLPGIDLREAAQLAWLEACRPLYADMPFGIEARPGLRYRFENGAYSYFDAITLHFMLRRLKPRRVIEVGSGHSTCVILDTIERCLDGTTALTCIEPYPALLQSLLKPGDSERMTLVGQRLQDVPLTLFEQLDAGDVLFIDSTHVCKIGSDVRRLFDEILPALRPGVVVHLHDIFYPFEYPRYWIEEGRAWNEAYVLRAFLQYNNAFRIEFWNHYVALFHPEMLRETMPLCLRNPGASLWLSRLA